MPYPRLPEIVALAAMLTPPLGAATCEELAKLTLPSTTIATAATASGAFTPPGATQPFKDMPEFCRVTGSIKPSSDSDIQFEVWMPASGWNGKFQGMGNGGFAGSINYAPMAAAVRKGYATASTDTGHKAPGGMAGAIDATWALGHPEKITDFGYRALHETTDRAKAIVRAFYGNPPKHSYFSSCSNGGRQALMEAQRYPADYDGIIAGAPANYFTHLLAGSMWDMQATIAEPGAYIKASKLPAIEAAVLEACDAGDGVKDGVIDNPAQCHFDPSKLLCQGAESDSCLTAPQLEALKKIYSGPKNSKGQSIFPGYAVGGETGFGGWTAWITGISPGASAQAGFGNGFFKNMVFDDASWDFKTFQVDRDIKIADDKVAQRLNAVNPDLSAFKKRGGKLIIYHGWSDAAIPPQNAIDYYKSVESKMGAKGTDSFVRLFMVPGMQHCGGGPGPSSFGQGGAAQGDARHDAAAALEHWVEDGVAPEQIIASKLKSPVIPDSEVVRTRPLCAYPKVAKWNGQGSTDDAANFACVSLNPAR